MIRIDIDRSSFRKEHFILQLKEEQESCLAEHGSCFIYWNTFCNKTEKLIPVLYIIKNAKKIKLQMTMMAAIAEFERAMILERQREGIAIAKRAGKYKGRKAVSIPNIGEYYDRYMSRQGTKISIAAELGISRTTLDKLFGEYKSNPVK